MYHKRTQYQFECFLCVHACRFAFTLANSSLMRGDNIRMLRLCELQLCRIESLSGIDPCIAMAYCMRKGKTNSVRGGRFCCKQL